MAGITKSFFQKDFIDGKQRQDRWQPLWPNPADFPFNFHNLMKSTEKTGIANVAGTAAADQRIAIIGAGYGGLTTARELYRAGFRNIRIFEATNRISGRGYTVMPKRKDGQTSRTYTPFENGAMRIPFFTPQVPGQEDQGNSLMQYYCDQYKIQKQFFPNPGRATSDGSLTTGIYMNVGYGPAPDPDHKVGILRWTPISDNPDSTVPPTQELKDVCEKWNVWAKKVNNKVATMYQNSEEWRSFWQKIVKNYHNMNFRDVAITPIVDDPAEIDQGNFGGLGMNASEATIFYTIGAGDGSWGAFFDIAALYPMRTLLFGYADEHFLLTSVNYEDLPHPDKVQLQAEIPFTDSVGNDLTKPMFLGAAAIPEMHYFYPVRSNINSIDQTSLHEAALDPNSDIHLESNNAVIKLDTDGTHYQLGLKDGSEYEADHIVFTQTGWSFQMNTTQTEAFTKRVFIEGSENKNQAFTPIRSRESLKLSHNITSSKIFFKLKSRYWADDRLPEEKRIPQTLVTDSFLQDVYGYAVDTNHFGHEVNDPGVLLCSYVWEDDANKYLSDDTPERDEKIALKCLNKLDEILVQSGYQPMSDYVDFDYEPEIWHWSEQEWYRSCAKLYRAGTFDWNYALLSWNQNHSADKNIYMAGEFASLEGGWIEPAYRAAIDTVIHMVKNTVPQAEWPTRFNDWEMISNYPVIANWTPESD